MPKRIDNARQQLARVVVVCCGLGECRAVADRHCGNVIPGRIHILRHQPFAVGHSVGQIC